MEHAGCDGFVELWALSLVGDLSAYYSIVVGRISRLVGRLQNEQKV
jgi:hypothetical protein